MGLAKLQGTSPALIEEILELTKGESRKCGDIPRLFAAATLLCHLVACEEPVRSSALQAVLTLLINRYPKV